MSVYCELTGSLNHDGVIRPNDNILYHITIMNQSTYVLYKLVIADELHTINTVIDKLRSNETCVFDTTYTITQKDIDHGSVTNTVTVQKKSVTHTTEIAQVPSLVLSKSSPTLSYHSGQVLEFNYTIYNAGNVTLTDIQLSDEVPQFLQTITSLSPTAMWTGSSQYHVIQTDLDRQEIGGICQVSALDPLQEILIVEANKLMLPCVLPDTLIRMVDGTSKKIQDLKRGECVFPNHRIARVTETPINPKQVVDVMIFSVGSLERQIPNKQLMITPNHPLVWQNTRRPAKCFRSIIGVSMTRLTGVEKLYDLQFDHEGSYYANGVEVQSCSPHSSLNPLPKELYYNPLLYTGQMVWDTFDHPLKLVTEPVRSSLDRYKPNRDINYSQ
jgi:uncharacterized repeat protein (TIGR01451 family)